MESESKHYDHKAIEAKWQKAWQETDAYRADDGAPGEKRMIMDMYPYPSAAGLHVGHVESYTATDIYSRYLRMQRDAAGAPKYNVAHPQGWDAFGLPAENYAIKTGVHPSITTHEAIANFKRQMNTLGLSYDWSREVATCDADYYRWTQWFFLFLYQNGLAYKKKAKANWCDSCQTVLANEQAEGGKCDRCGSPVIQKDLEQWFFKITDFVDDQEFEGRTIKGLLSGMDDIDWPDSTKAAQRNWIGRSEGAIVNFTIDVPAVDDGIATAASRLRNDGLVPVFTTRPDTLFGATYFVMAPEHPLVAKIVTPEQKAAVDEYISATRAKTELERTDLNKDKSGVFTGAYAVNPVNDEKIPVWIADYVLMEYGTGAIMAVPAHDERDFAFAKKYDLPVVEVVKRSELVRDDGKKSKVVILHGRQRFDKQDEPPQNVRHWRGWLTDRLNEQGYKAFNPLVPQDWEAEYDEWKQAIPEKEIDENTILVGTSAGGAFWVRWLGETKRQIRRLILVAPSYSPNTNIDVKQQFYDFPLDPTIKDRVAEGVTVYISNDEEKNVRSAHDYTTALGARLVELPDRGHFTLQHSDKNREIPEVLEEILAADHGGATGSFAPLRMTNDEEFFTGDGVAVNSGFLDGLPTPEAKTKMIDWLMEKGLGERKINYRLRDWLVSRQRYWGAPIPIIYCDVCGTVPVPEKDLPVLLPEDVDFKPTGESPLTYSPSFQNVTCPKCGAKAKREADTMDTFVCSSWYYFRYADPKNENEFAAKEKMAAWLPVDVYVGGAEHTVLHLLYSRFFTKALQKYGYIDFNEPFQKLRHQGIILAEDGTKMSKSKGNVVNPDDVVTMHGADTLRLYEMFMGPLEDMKPWSTQSIIGVRRFLERVWRLSESIKGSVSSIKEEKSPLARGVPRSGEGCGGEPEKRLLHKTIKKVTEDIEAFKFNTAVSAMMILTNAWEKAGVMKAEDFALFLRILSPFAPHLCEELWATLGNDGSIFKQPWPAYDPALVVDETVTLAVQVNGKLRATLSLPADTTEDDAKSAALNDEGVKKWTEGKQIVKVIYVKGRMVSIVVN